MIAGFFYGFGGFMIFATALANTTGPIPAATMSRWCRTAFLT
jgi:hypothetical protein